MGEFQAISVEQDLVVSGSLSGLFIHSLYDGDFIRVVQHPAGRQPYIVLLSKDTEIIAYYQDIQEIGKSHRPDRLFLHLV